jgi:hypothetical protein
MTDTSVEKEIINEIHKLGEDQQKEVLGNVWYFMKY